NLGKSQTALRKIKAKGHLIKILANQELCAISYKRVAPGKVREMARSQPSRPTALIVEDELLIARDLEKAMADLGYEVCLAASESKARSLAMQHHPDIVLMDVCLGREGIETGRWLRAVCGTSVVFVTSEVDANTVQRIHQQVPGAPVVSKPVH